MSKKNIKLSNSQSLIATIKEADIIIKDIKQGKRKGYNDEKSLFEALKK